MKTWKLLPIMFMGTCMALASCSEDSKKEDVVDNPFKNFSTPDKGQATDADLKGIVATYVDDVVIPTYRDMYNKMDALNKAVKKLSATSTDNEVSDAADAWREARRPWEKSEAFLYGPADENKLDPSLDSWPLDKGGIDKILATGNWSNAITGEVNDEDDAPKDAPQNLRGFHTAEYLLFEGGEARKAKELDATKIGYLQAVVGRLLQDAELLWKGWEDGKGLNSGAYGVAMKEAKGTYAISSTKKAIALLLNASNGAEGIANEVGVVKIGDPVDKWNNGEKEAAVLAVESWYSWNSIDDYTDNIYSIRNAYYGSLNGQPAANSIYKVMEKVNPELNKLVVDQIKKTVDAINDIPRPFRNNLDKRVEIKNAQHQCAILCDGIATVRRKLAGE